MDTEMTTEQTLGEVITSKGMVLMAETIHDGEVRRVRLGQRIEWEGEPWFVIGGTAPQYLGAPGRVYLKHADTGRKLELHTPSVNMTWRVE